MCISKLCQAIEGSDSLQGTQASFGQSDGVFARVAPGPMAHVAQPRAAH